MERVSPANTVRILARYVEAGSLGTPPGPLEAAMGPVCAYDLATRLRTSRLPPSVTSTTAVTPPQINSRFSRRAPVESVLHSELG